MRQVSESVTRFVVTHINVTGIRVLTYGQQARYTYATAADAQSALDALLNVAVNGNDIPGVFGPQAVGTFEVRPIPCWPHTLDPQTCWLSA